MFGAAVPAAMESRESGCNIGGDDALMITNSR